MSGSADRQATSTLGLHVWNETLALGLDEHLAAEVACVAEPMAALLPPEARVPGPGLIGCDLDRTLIYSGSALALPSGDLDPPRMVVVEVYRGVPLSFMTRDAEHLLATLARCVAFVPVTTRTLAQLERVRLWGVPATYAIAANGGHLLVDGVPCPDWRHSVAARLSSGCAPLDEIVAHLDAVSAYPWLRLRRTADDLFAYLVVERAELPAGFIDDLTEWCAARAWTVSLQGRKVYAVPEPLSKAAALEELARRTGATWTLAAGDSLLDVKLLESASAGVRPAHGELHDVGWHAAHVAVTDRAGVLGGQELVARLLASVLGRGSAVAVDDARG